MSVWHTTTEFNVNAWDNRTKLPTEVEVCSHIGRKLLRVAQHNPDRPDTDDFVLLDREAAVLLAAQLIEFIGGTVCEVH